ncbi:acetyl-CoA hydrolase/transferase family protein [Nocardioides daeguensis]|uniref:Acetyl-CoA hydrolase/transferase family protein n=1 Tax=Nocardioides daeguensis TaxID=908359 RepID=A0ABP6UWA3_9ACTN|nr:acetyl-CoA hydrolase/transferase family protein [Nocardioides daeguensis]MBV6725815.1 acetyl-CoA hydrolase/transferase family protein [Nocardioides daeguensis]MCR1772670.1 acetyl-CoA hydrolase/transferase family protein [Nocardioides daeguensis]
MERITCPVLATRRATAEEAAAHIRPGNAVGMSGFTGAGYPKAVPGALAARIDAAHARGEDFQVSLWTGASTAPELDGALAGVDGLAKRLPYNSDPTLRRLINDGKVDYVDTHLSHSAQQAWFGFYGDLDVAVVEVAAVLPNGLLVPSSSVGNNKTWLERANKVILEVNHWQPREFEGFHDVYYGAALPPHRIPIQLTHAMQRIGDPYLRVDPAKVVAIVETDAPDRNAPFDPPDASSQRMAGLLVDFLRHEVKQGRLPASLLPLQSGVGNVANAVMEGLLTSEFEEMTAFTEVIQDGLLDLLDAGKLSAVSATSFGLSPDGVRRFLANPGSYKGRILLRSQEISNHPELVRRLGVIAINGMIEADIYGNVNSTHIMGSSIMNGIGGSGDFARNAYLNFFVSDSLAKDGAISSIVPMVSHVDHTEHDVQVLVTEQGLADLRGLSPSDRATRIIDRCAHPDYRDRLRDYVARARAARPHAQHTPHLLDEALGWHANYVRDGRM